MARTKRGSKPMGYDYWGKMKGGWTVDRKTSTKMQRMKYKEDDRELLKEYFNNPDHQDCTYYSHLFDGIEVREIFVLPDCLMINDEIVNRSYVDKLMSFQYFTGASFVDYFDLVLKYEESVVEFGEDWWYP